ncbi:MAG: nucleotidyltransferase domain-containing protein [Candidatus Delongbacteria bacterium]|nr:nucleotidyltransferase domain-containing protein [Candidatus Delongbacteria bacterium]MBN2833782.1 nucleotidyltransferase domain-containing protein [Candidatus Delongbacteria bacterium]
MYKPREVSEILKSFLYGRDDVIAAWEGGSAATGYYDEFSDLDLAIVSEDDKVEEIFTAFEDLISEKFGIIRKYRIPEPAWHGFSQCFYQIDNVPKLYYLDIAVIKKSIKDKFTESDRHGDAVVWFEKEKMIDSTPFSEESKLELCKKMYKAATSADFLILIEVKKNLGRDRFSEAFPPFYQFLNRFLAPLLNILHRPEKADFGLRYAYRDYPQADFQLIEKSFAVSNCEELKTVLAIVEERYEELVNVLVRLK